MKILLGILLSITAAFSLLQIDLSSDLKSDDFVMKEYEHKTSHGSGEKIMVTTSYSWLSENDEEKDASDIAPVPFCFPGEQLHPEEGENRWPCSKPG